MSELSEWISAGATVCAAVAAVFSWRSAKKSAEATKKQTELMALRFKLEGATPEERVLREHIAGK